MFPDTQLKYFPALFFFPTAHVVWTSEATARYREWCQFALAEEAASPQSLHMPSDEFYLFY